jgi:FkbM family methyltransferase
MPPAESRAPLSALARFLSALLGLGGVCLFALEVSLSSLPHAAPGRAALPAAAAAAAAAAQPAAAAYACRPHEIFAQASEFLRQPRETATGCPPRELMWPLLVGKGLSCRPLTIVNVGANKGYLIASLIDLIRPAMGITPASLHAHIKAPAVAERQNVHDGCGFCNDCLEGHLPAAQSAARACFSDAGAALPRDSFPLALHAFEPTTSNSELLDYGVFALLRAAPNSSGVTAALHRQAVVGDPAVTVVAFGNCKAGVERCGVADAGNGFVGATGTDTDIGNVNVPATTLDAWADLEGVRGIDLLAIDTEGMDPEVLRGAERLLSQRRVRILEFEYHVHRAWRATSLEAVVARLDALGMDCFFENLASLTRLTGCWHGSYEVRGWSNVVCALRSEEAVMGVLHALTVAVNKR